MSDQTTIGVERPLRVGVIGVGVMGSNHARVFAGLPGTELVGIADPDAKQAEFVANTLGCSAVGDVDGLIALGIDAVTVAAPTHLHRDIAIACIARGVHVMVEKPIASTVEEGHEIISAALLRAEPITRSHHVELEIEKELPGVRVDERAVSADQIVHLFRRRSLHRLLRIHQKHVAHELGPILTTAGARTKSGLPPYRRAGNPTMRSVTSVGRSSVRK